MQAAAKGVDPDLQRDREKGLKMDMGWKHGDEIVVKTDRWVVSSQWSVVRSVSFVDMHARIRKHSCRGGLPLLAAVVMYHVV